MAVSDQQVLDWLKANPKATDAQIAQIAKDAGVSAAQLSRVTGVSSGEILARANTAGTSLYTPEQQTRQSEIDSWVKNSEPIEYQKLYYALQSGQAKVDTLDNGRMVVRDASNNILDGVGVDPNTGQLQVPTYNGTLYVNTQIDNTGKLAAISPENYNKQVSYQSSGSDWDQLAPIAMMAAGAFGAPYLSQFLGGATGLTGASLNAATGATIGGLGSAVTGNDPLKGALLGGLGGYAYGSLSGSPAPTDLGMNSQLTPAAIEAGLGTAGYGYNAGAAASGLFSPEVIGAGAGLGASALGEGMASGVGTAGTLGAAGAAGTAGGAAGSLGNAAGAAGAASGLSNLSNAAKLAGAVGALGAAAGAASSSTPSGAGIDYMALADKTAANNLAMAKYTTAANRVNQTNQYGSSTWKYVPQYDAQGKETGFGWEQTTTLNPEQQALFNSQTAGNQALSDTANKALAGSSILQNPNIDFSKLPSAPISPGMTAQQAMLSRLNPQLQQYDNALAQRLANQGITLGSEAYNREMNLASQRRNDLELQAASQGISLDQAARQQALGEQQVAINTPLNTINALRSGSQVSNPTFQNYNTQANVAGADSLSAANQQYQNQLNASNAQRATNAGIFGGLAQLGTAALMAPTGTFSGLFG